MVTLPMFQKRTDQVTCLDLYDIPSVLQSLQGTGEITRGEKGVRHGSKHIHFSWSLP